MTVDIIKFSDRRDQQKTASRIDHYGEQSALAGQPKKKAAAIVQTGQFIRQ
jgi:hypothetical protein